MDAFIRHAFEAYYLIALGTSLLITLGILLLCGLTGLWAIRWLHERKEDYYWFTKLGRIPTNDKSVTIQEHEQRKFKWKRIGTTSSVIAVLFLSGTVVPTLLFASAIKYYGIANPNDVPFVRDGHALSTLTPADLASFTVSQLGRSALLDTLEIFGVKASPVEARSGDKAIELVIFVYRTFVESFVGAALIALLLLLRTAARPTYKEKVLSERHTIGWKIFKR